jgi:hypothetical protein
MCDIFIAANDEEMLIFQGFDDRPCDKESIIYICVRACVRLLDYKCLTARYAVLEVFAMGKYVLLILPVLLVVK